MKKHSVESKKLLVSVEKLRDLRPEDLQRAAGGNCPGKHSTANGTNP